MSDYKKILTRISSIRVAVMGDLMVDCYMKGTVNRISPEAPVPIVQVTSSDKKLGGAGNVIMNLDALGAQVRVLGYTGDDNQSRFLKQRLLERGVDSQYLISISGYRTSTKTRITSQNHQLLRFDEEDVAPAPIEFVRFLAENVDAALSDVDALIISDYGKGAVTHETAKCMISAAKRRGIPVVVDPKGTDYTKYSGSNLCTPNLKELGEAIGYLPASEDDIFQAGMSVCAKYDISRVLVTRSENGMSLIDGSKGTKQDFPAQAREVIDVTGAGDTVISVLTSTIAAGASIDEGCRLANVAASVVVSKFGAATASAEEILRALVVDCPKHRKILSTYELLDTVERLRSQGKKIVFTNGCFDIVHAGHIASFRKAKATGDILIVAVNTDRSVRALKGSERPINNQENRMALLEAIDHIDYLTLFDSNTPEDLIRSISPDVLIKGMDWKGKPIAGADWVQAHGGTVTFIDLEEGLSTTNIIEKIIEIYKQKDDRSL